MRKPLLVRLCTLLCIVLIAPMIYENVQATNHLTNKSSRSRPGIEGYVVNKTNRSILVVSSDSQDFSDTGGIEEFYNAIWVSNVMQEIDIGQRVKVWFDGPILESFPGQGRADEIEIVPSNTSQGTNLSEAQVIKEVIQHQAKQTNHVIAIKEVNYDKRKDTWNVLLRETQTEKEWIVVVADH